MKLSTFILKHIDRILAEWDAFARTIAPADGNLTDLALRDHAREMLREIAEDMLLVQSEAQRRSKSQEGEDELDGTSSAAIHGAQRHLSEFSLVQLSAEFRALRATVLRLWLDEIGEVQRDLTDDMLRFNEALDKALAESIVAFSERTAQTREMFLAVLGHDLRSPLATLAMAGELLARPELPPDTLPDLARRVTRATSVMRHMVEDLLGFTRMQLGKGTPVRPDTCDLGEVLEAAMTDSMATYPGTVFDLDVPAGLVGDYDRSRIYQVFVNLLVNAAQHGAKGQPVLIQGRAGATTHIVRISNRGQTIPAGSLDSIFKPLVQLNPEADTRQQTSLGLGLYIAKSIVESHGGVIAVTSSDRDGTTFSVSLPHAPADAA